ncbi:hypothetical protein EON65_37555 [archaeon]|nr:MAG: hypothetical protein EON65_37555 [archaeon]
MEVSFNDLILGRRIGQGACSSVNLAQNRRTGETYAIKLFNIYDRGQASQLYNEILLLTSFSCDALISLKVPFHFIFTYIFTQTPTHSYIYTRNSYIYIEKTKLLIHVHVHTHAH